MPASPETSTTVSAPGKVLLAGGYLVLESPNPGYVIAADKRFYTTVKDVPNTDKEFNTILVKSPQFHTAWNYSFFSADGSVSLECNSSTTTIDGVDQDAKTNQFVEKTLRVFLAYLKAAQDSDEQQHPLQSLEITIRADNDFYSVRSHLQEQNCNKVEDLPRFCNCPVDSETGVVTFNKTGLGSSAALATSLIGALYYHWFRKLELRNIHNLAQICHCYAQGKVGSGFDVSAAMYGPHVYRRFPLCILPDLLQQLDHEPTTISPMASMLLDQVVHSSWYSTTSAPSYSSEDEDEENFGEDSKDRKRANDDDDSSIPAPLPLPEGLQLLLADICGGSESPSMAKTVLKWKQTHFFQSPTNIPHWTSLQKWNQKLISLLETIAVQETPSLQNDVDQLAILHASEWGTAANHPLLTELHETLKHCRTELKGMGEAAGVPIEPDVQTQLIDATMALKGVVGAVVPGAGGYDAIACLYIDKAEVKESIEQLWARWKPSSPSSTESEGQEESESKNIVCPLSVQAANEGIRLETDFEEA